MKPHPQVRREHGAEFESDPLACVITMTTKSPTVHSLMQNVPPTLKIILFTFPPKSEASVFDPKQLSVPGWEQNSSKVPLLLGPRRPGLVSILSVLTTRGREAWHAQFCLSPDPRKFHRLRARPALQAESRGSIFSDNSYSVSSSMMRALSSKY